MITVLLNETHKREKIDVLNLVMIWCFRVQKEKKTYCDFAFRILLGLITLLHIDFQLF